MKHSLGAGLCSLAAGCVGLGLVLTLEDAAIALPPALARIFLRHFFHAIHVGVNVYFWPISWFAHWNKAPWTAGSIAAIVWGSLLYALLLLISAGLRGRRPNGATEMARF